MSELESETPKRATRKESTPADDARGRARSARSDILSFHLDHLIILPLQSVSIHLQRQHGRSSS